MEKINWGRMLSKKKALRVVVQRNLVRIQLGHVVPATNDEKIHSFVLDVEIPLGVEATYDLASALGAAAFEANRPWPWGRKGALALEEEPSVEHPRRTSPSNIPVEHPRRTSPSNIPVERIPIEPGELGSEYLERVVAVAKARRAAVEIVKCRDCDRMSSPPRKARIFQNVEIVKCRDCDRMITPIIGGQRDQFRTCPECAYTWDVPPTEG